MIKKLLLILLLILLPTALAMQITPSTQSVDVFSTSARNAFVNITNNLEEDIYLVNLNSNNPDISFLQNNFNMTTNQTKEIKMVIETSSTYDEESIIDVIFFRKSDVINAPTTENIAITSTGYSPNNIEVFTGSTLIWNNDDNIKHSVTSTIFDQDIDPTLSWQYIINQVGIFDYSDKYTFYSGEIIVKDLISEEYIHNPTEDEHFYLNINSHLVETDLSIDTLGENDFEVEANDNLESVLVIENIGDKTAELVKLTSSPGWINFGLNDLYIEAGKKKYIPYTITPLIINREDTDKHYNLSINVQGSNTNPTNATISLYIPYKDSITINDTASALFNQSFDDSFILALFNTVCGANPEHPVCNPVEIEKIVYRDSYVSYNYSSKDIDNYNTKVNNVLGLIDREMKTSQADMQTIKDDVRDARTFSAETRMLLNQSIAETIEQKKTEKAIMVVVVVFLVIIIVMIIFGYSWFYLKRKVQIDKVLET